MKLPPRHTKLGKVLRAMYRAGPQAAGQIRKKARLAPDTAITARIRELRDTYGCTIPPAVPHKQLDGSTIYKYHMKAAPRWIRDGLRVERERMAEMGVAA